MTRVGVLLCGSGHRDGSEIHEAVLTMAALEEAGATLDCLAPARPQVQVVNHLTGQPVAGASRSMIEEAARIARGRIRDVRTATPAQLDALVIPGGFGAAYNLCDFATRGEAMTVDPDVEKLLLAMHEAGKPIGAVCIAPVILARVFGRFGVRLTLGTDPETAAKASRMGATHVACDTAHCVTDERHLLVSTPAYMLGESIRDINPGIKALAGELMRLTQKGR